MKIVERKIFVIFFCAIITAMAYYFGMASYIPFSEKLYSGDWIFLGLGLFSVLTLIILVALHRSPLFCKGMFASECASLLLLLLVEAIFSFVQYDQPFFFVVKEVLYYVIVLFVYFVFIQFRDHTKTEEMLDFFIKASLACSLIALVAFFLYSYLGINLLKFSTAEDHFRNGTVRFDVGKNIVFIGVIASLTKLVRTEHTKIDLLNIILGAIHIYFVMKTRTVVLYFLILFVVSPIFVTGAKKKWKLIGMGAFLIFLSCAAVFFSDLMRSWQMLWSDDIGNVVRIDAMQFYLKQFCESPILGMGFVSNNSNLIVSRLLMGVDGKFYRDDVGLIGFLNAFGIAGVFWLGYFFKKTLGYIRGRTDLSSNVTKMLIVYSIISLPNLCIMNSQRVVLIAVIMVLIEYVYREDLYDKTP